MACKAPVWKQILLKSSSPLPCSLVCPLKPLCTMLQSPSLLWATFTTLITLARSTALFTNESLTCHSDCSLDESNTFPVLIFAWANYNDFVDSDGQEVETVTSSATIVTVVNTVLDATSLLTEYPPNYQPPATNAEGTRVTTITYTRFSTTYTTVLYVNRLEIVAPT
jgi:hypothetical protein